MSEMSHASGDAREGAGRKNLLGAAHLPRASRQSYAWLVLLIVGLVLLARDAQAIQSAVLGAGTGSLISALALGIVVIYRGSGVINVATGAMAMYSSYVFNGLNTEGKLLLIAWPVDLGAPWALVPALALTLMVAAFLGVVLYLLVFAPLREASPIAKVVASVGILLVLQALIVLQFGATGERVTATFGEGFVRITDDVVVPINQLVLGGCVIVLAVALWAVYRFTIMGLATRAAAEDERHLTLIGRSPLLVSGGNWLFAGVVVALFAVLAAPLNGSVDPSSTTLLVVPALAAALLGRFTSFGWAAVGGVAIGVLQALIQYASTKSWFPAIDGQPIPGVRETVPLIIILVTLAVRRGGIGARGALGTVRLPFAPQPTHVMPKLGVGLLIGIIGLLVLSSPWRLAEINTLVGIAVCLSFVTLTGFVGQVSLAQMALAGVSGFVLAKLSTNAGIGFPFAPLIGAGAATIVGVLAAVPALRARGVQLAVVTLAAAVAIENLVFRNPGLSGGLTGASVPAPSLFGNRFGPTDAGALGDGTIPNPWFGIFCVVVVVGLAGLTSQLRASSWGRRMLAVRANERAASAVGISVGQTKIVAFALSAFIAGIAGALSGYRFGTVTPEYFGVMGSLTFLAFAYMGGISSVTGAVIGGMLVPNGMVFTILDRWVGLSPDYALLVGGVGLILTVVTSPDGIAGAARQAIERVKARGGGAPPDGNADRLDESSGAVAGATTTMERI